MQHLPLTARTLNNCIKYSDRSIADLAARTPEQLFDRRNFGPGSFLDVVLALRTYLAPWLERLPADALLGYEQSGVMRKTDASETPPANAFDALRDSDLLAALELYEAPWRDLTVAALVGAEEPSRDVPAPDGIAPPLEQANHLLAHLTPLLAGRQVEASLYGLTLGELLDTPPTEADPPWLPAGEHVDLIRELGEALTARLLRYVLRPTAWLPTLTSAADALERVTVAALLSELFGTSDVLGRRSQRHAVEILYARNGLADGQPCTLEMLGLRMGVTRERVRQIEQRVYEQLKSPHGQAMTRALGELVRRTVEACG
ncbi:MAG: sigma factor-like helix-turn-helix DNA-binding protein, partial [Ktedonobacterales bacterium]